MLMLMLSDGNGSAVHLTVMSATEVIEPIRKKLKTLSIIESIVRTERASSPLNVSLASRRS